MLLKPLNHTLGGRLSKNTNHLSMDTETGSLETIFVVPLTTSMLVTYFIFMELHSTVKQQALS